MSAPKNWLAVASAEHVRKGRELGFMQVCHGKLGPLRRVHPGDGVGYYSPTVSFQGKDKLQSFTAVGIVKQGQPYEVDWGGGFRPHRRDVDWWPALEASILPLLNLLEFTAAGSSWGYQLRFGLFPISDHDFKLIAETMCADVAAVEVG
ncbi:MAG: EVE domain-containing protein [Hyphomicrobiales bacterium]|nr:EVE domain-containing protein [Hyphomicrobiales bacterium]